MDKEKWSKMKVMADRFRLDIEDSKQRQEKTLAAMSSLFERQTKNNERMLSHIDTMYSEVEKITQK